MKKRSAELSRKTNETEIRVMLNLDGSGVSHVTSGVPFLDHMLSSLAKHGRIDLELTCTGDLDVDDHHTVEDCAIVIGSAVDQALGDKTGIARFGYAYAPLDESLVRSVIDFSGRGCCTVALNLTRPSVGTLSTENVPHFFRSFAFAARCTLHLDLIRGENDHHRIEAAFKAFALSLRSAVMKMGTEIPSTKGVL